MPGTSTTSTKHRAARGSHTTARGSTRRRPVGGDRRGVLHQGLGRRRRRGDQGRATRGGRAPSLGHRRPPGAGVDGPVVRIPGLFETQRRGRSRRERGPGAGGRLAAERRHHRVDTGFPPGATYRSSRPGSSGVWPRRPSSSPSPPFGLEGPWAEAPSSDLTLQAWAGSVFSRGSPDRPPVQIGGRPAEWLGGLFAAVGALTVVAPHRTHGRGRAPRRVDPRVDRADRADVRLDQAVDDSSRDHARSPNASRAGP